MNEFNPANMPLTQNEINSFFRDNDQMGLSIRTQAHLATEGIVTLGDLAELNNEMAMRLAHTSSQSRTDAL